MPSTINPAKLLPTETHKAAAHASPTETSAPAAAAIMHVLFPSATSALAARALTAHPLRAQFAAMPPARSTAPSDRRRCWLASSTMQCPGQAIKRSAEGPPPMRAAGSAGPPLPSKKLRQRSQASWPGSGSLAGKKATLPLPAAPTQVLNIRSAGPERRPSCSKLMHGAMPKRGAGPWPSTGNLSKQAWAAGRGGAALVPPCSRWPVSLGLTALSAAPLEARNVVAA